jgi:DNA-directed RNA polymerase subunit RPC12/RpoP
MKQCLKCKSKVSPLPVSVGRRTIYCCPVCKKELKSFQNERVIAMAAVVIYIIVHLLFFS